MTFDVTLSGRLMANPTPLNQLPTIISYFRAMEVKTVLDFGAGQLRNTWLLLKSRSFDVYVTDFPQLIPDDSPNLTRAKRLGLKTLIYPNQLIDAPLKFDAILLSYVLNILPDKRTRNAVLRVAYQKSRPNTILVVASPKYNTVIRRSCRPEDEYNGGWIRYAPDRYTRKCYYSEPTRDALLELISPIGFEYDDEWRQSTAHVLRFIKK